MYYFILAAAVLCLPSWHAVPGVVGGVGADAGACASHAAAAIVVGLNTLTLPLHLQVLLGLCVQSCAQAFHTMGQRSRV